MFTIIIPINRLFCAFRLCTCQTRVSILHIRTRQLIARATGISLRGRTPVRISCRLHIFVFNVEYYVFYVVFGTSLAHCVRALCCGMIVRHTGAALQSIAYACFFPSASQTEAHVTEAGSMLFFFLG